MAGPSIDYYYVMGLARTADPEDIKLAYRRLAMRLHPDRNPGNPLAESRFKLLLEAYHTLSDPDLRAEYDILKKYRPHERKPAGPGTNAPGTAGETAAGQRWAGRRTPPEHETETRKGAQEDIQSQVGNIFSGLDETLGRKSSGPLPLKGADLRCPLTLDFKSAVFGAKREIAFQARALCRVCGGSGAKPGSRLTPCGSCFGKGEDHQGNPCGRCLGHGVLAVDHCVFCKGEGVLSTKRKLTVSIPPGCDTGSRIRISGEGEPGTNGGPAGDLLLTVTVEEHPIFFRQGPDIVCELPLSFSLAAMGGTVEVPTIDGKENLRIKPGIQHGEIITLKKKGAPHNGGNGDRGDHKFIITIEVPKRLSARQRELLSELMTLEGPDSLVGAFARRIKEVLG